MPTKQELQERLEILKTAVSTGVLRVKHGETETLYRSLDEMNKIIRDLEAEIANFGTTRKRGPRYVRQETKG